MKFIKRFSKSVPMALCGLSLGLAALGNLLNHPFSPFRRRIVETAYPAIEWLYNPELATTLRYICGWLSLIVLLVFAMKLIFDFPHAREELKTPVPLSVLPTATMAVMLLSTYLIGHLPNIIVAIIWAAAFVTQIGIMAVFFCRFIPKFKLGTVFPSWFIILVGMATASVTAPAINGVTGDWINIVSIGQAVFYITLVLYLIGLPIVITRMIKVRIFPEPAKKTIAIFAAPMGLSIVGFYSSFVAPTVPATPAGFPAIPMWQPSSFHVGLVFFMFAVAAIAYIFALVMSVTKLLWIRFYPSYSAFTFPLVISALAFRFLTPIVTMGYITGFSESYDAYGEIVRTQIRNNPLGWSWFNTFADVAMWIGVVAVIYVLVHYIKYFCYWLTFTCSDTGKTTELKV